MKSLNQQMMIKTLRETILRTSWVCVECTFETSSGILCAMCNSNRPIDEEVIKSQGEQKTSDNDETSVRVKPIIQKSPFCNGLVAHFECPTCHKKDSSPIGYNSIGNLQFVNSGSFEKWMSNNLSEDDFVCSTFQCNCSEEHQMSQYHATALNNATSLQMMEWFDGWVDGANKFDFLQTSDAVKKRKHFIKGDQLPQHMTSAGRRALGVATRSLTVVLN